MLALKAAALLAMMVGVFYLTLRAKRFGFDRFRSIHSRRKIRVPAPRPKDGPPDCKPKARSERSERRPIAAAKRRRAGRK
jgi:hypothetical protein